MRLAVPISRERPFCIHHKHETMKRTVRSLPLFIPNLIRIDQLDSVPIPLA